jgi:hypothetical protein
MLLPDSQSVGSEKQHTLQLTRADKQYNDLENETKREITLLAE